MKLTATQRRREILKRAQATGTVTVFGLAKELNTDKDTVRRDITMLQEIGVLKRVFGGSAPVAVDASAARSRANRRIATAALPMVPSKGTVLLDTDGPASTLASLIPADSAIAVLTTGMSTAITLSARGLKNVTLLGGRAEGPKPATADEWAAHLLDGTEIDLAFIAADGVDARHGLTAADPNTAAFKRAAIANAGAVVALAEHGGIGIGHAVRFGEIIDIRTLVTDEPVAPTAAADIWRSGVTIVTG